MVLLSDDWQPEIGMVGLDGEDNLEIRLGSCGVKVYFFFFF